ncbi:MAG: thermonuclease family protein [Alphaproteobacteria bacterium]|nr:thermonuclease family protein [Alphaproteobacteria bacterium]
MSLRQPRRIFRASSAAARGSRRRLPGAVMAGLFIGTFGLFFILLAAPAELLGRVPPLTGAVSAGPARVAVVDGETPHRGQACSAAEGAADCGAQSAAALAGLLRDRDVLCRFTGRDQEGFPRAICEAGGRELNSALVRAGWARARAEMPGLAIEEAHARAAGLGLWRIGGF